MIEPFTWRDLILIGLAVIANGFGFHSPTGYIYFAMAFCVTVEIVNLRVRRKRLAAISPVHLKRGMVMEIGEERGCG